MLFGLVLLAGAIGFAIPVATYAILGDVAFNLPGGSMVSGLSLGLSCVAYFRPRAHAALAILGFIGMISGLLGFSIFLALF